MKFILTFLVSVCALSLNAQLRIAEVFSDHMVLQQQADVAIWGWAGPGEVVTLKPSWDKEQIVKVQADNMAVWRATLKTPVGGYNEYTINIKAGNYELTLNDVVIGEVWLCSGQSNMEWSASHGVADATDELPKANTKNIRLLQVSKAAAPYPQAWGEGNWRLCSTEMLKGFSATAYFFGKKLNAELKVPIGLINASWGGSPAEVWTPADRINSDPELKASNDKLTKYDWWPKDAGVAYNAMIKPMVPYGIAGALWYQGEANISNSSTYAKLMAALIAGWRADFGKDLPFYYVQIAPYAYEKEFEGALVREQQSKMITFPGTGMVIVSDAVDDIHDIHPKFKKPVGDRLANYALADHYKKPLLGYQSPVYKSMAVEKNKIRLSFEYAQVGLISHDGPPTQFMIAGEDKKFYPAVAKIDGSTVVVSAKEVKAPVAVRFCFDNTSIPNLFNKEGLPVSIFRTDNWPLTPGH